MSAPEKDTQPNASQASISSNPAAEGQAAYPTPQPASAENGPGVDNPALPPQNDDIAQPKEQKRSSLKDRAKAGLASFGNKLKGIGGGGGSNDNESKNDEKEKEKEKNKDGSRLSMEGLLKQARISFEKWIDVERPHEYPMPNGIVFLTSIKGSFGWGAEAGTGIVLYRLHENNNSNDKSNDKSNESDKKDESNDKMDNNNNNNGNQENEGNEGNDQNTENKENKEDNNDKNDKNDESDKNDKNENKNKEIRWSGPCAIGSGGVSFGLQIGVSKVDHIIILPGRHHVRTFTSKGQLKLGGSSELTVVNVGGKAQGSVNIGAKEMSDIHSYSLDTKGLSIGVSVEGAVISIRPNCNNSFYGKNVSVEDIANGRAKIPEKTVNEDYNRIVELLNKHFKIYRPRPLHPHGSGPHGPPPGPHGPAPVIGAALGVVGALAHGPHGHGPRGGFHGGPRGGHHGPH